MGSIPITRSGPERWIRNDCSSLPESVQPIKETEADAEDERHRKVTNSAAVAQLVERVLGKDEVLGSNPSGSSWVGCPNFGRDK